MVEPTRTLEQLIERFFSRVAERRVSEIVRQSDGLHEVLVEAERSRYGAGDLRDLDCMREARPIMVPLMIDEDLRLVL